MCAGMSGAVWYIIIWGIYLGRTQVCPYIHVCRDTGIYRPYACNYRVPLPFRSFLVSPFSWPLGFDLDLLSAGGAFTVDLGPGNLLLLFTFDSPPSSRPRSCCSSLLGWLVLLPSSSKINMPSRASRKILTPSLTTALGIRTSMSANMLLLSSSPSPSPVIRESFSTSSYSSAPSLTSPPPPPVIYFPFVFVFASAFAVPFSIFNLPVRRFLLRPRPVIPSRVLPDAKPTTASTTSSKHSHCPPRSNSSASARTRSVQPTRCNELRSDACKSSRVVVVERCVMRKVVGSD